MKTGSTLLLKATLIIIALAVLAFAIFILPIGIKSDQIGYRPVLIGLYLPAIPFHFALYQAFNLLTYIDRNEAFSKLSVQALKKIKYCALAIAAMFLAGMPFIFNIADKDEAPGVVLLGLVVASASIVTATFAAVLQKLMQKGLDLKSENDLTV